MKFATVAETKNQLSKYLETAHRNHEPILVTRHGKPYAVIRPVDEADMEDLFWRRMAENSLRRAWEGEDDRLYDYL